MALETVKAATARTALNGLQEAAMFARLQRRKSGWQTSPQSGSGSLSAPSDRAFEGLVEAADYLASYCRSIPEAAWRRMSASALITVKLRRAPEARTSSKTGKPFTVANIREGCGEQATWWSVTAFSETADELVKLDAGDTVSVSGPFTAKIYSKIGAEPRVSFRIVADRIALPRLRERKEAA